jgi:nucleoside-diphosphate-sugar epimerase
MRVLVTGARGKVGRAAVAELLRAGHQVTASDLGPADRECPSPPQAPYVRAELTDAGAAHALVRGHDAVVHAAAIPEPRGDVPHVVFHNNVLSAFNVVEAAVRAGVTRLVNVSSVSVLGWFFPERPVLPEYLPADEEHPARPQDPYALGKLFGEQMCDAAVRRSDLRCLSLRLGWVQTPDTYVRNLGSLVSDAGKLDPAHWTYVDVSDVATALRVAVESDLPGHAVVNVAAADNPGAHDFAAAVRARYGDRVALRAAPRPDCSAIDISRGRELLGWEPRRSWREHLPGAPG